MFTINDRGCFADGTGGHHRIRVCLGNLLANMYRHSPDGSVGTHWDEVKNIRASLDSDMPDDAWDEIEAIEWLNKCCSWEVSFEMIDGDLILMPTDDYLTTIGNLASGDLCGN